MGICNSKKENEKILTEKTTSHQLKNEVQLECFLSGIETANMNFLINTKTIIMRLSTSNQVLCEVVLPPKLTSIKDSYSLIEKQECRFSITTLFLANDRLTVVI